MQKNKATLSHKQLPSFPSVTPEQINEFISPNNRKRRGTRFDSFMRPVNDSERTYKLLNKN